LKLPSSRLARATAAIILSLGLAYAALAQAVNPRRNTSEPLPNSDEAGRKQR
jgi:hypothetical protein